MFDPVEWLKINKKNVSEFGESVAILVNDLYSGIYNIEKEALKANWSDNYYIFIIVKDKNLCTYDSNLLTRLVILSHKYNVRSGIEAASNRYVRLVFDKITNSEFFRDNHPNLKDLIGDINEEIG